MLQERVVRSHAAGLGDPVEREVVRGTMLLRLKTMCSGRTGVRPLVAKTYAALLNAGITPVVPEFGSLGCSGDLAPLAHCALVALGEGDAHGPDGARPSAASLLADAGVAPLRLEAKEGLSLINGTDGMLGDAAAAPRGPPRARDRVRRAAAMSVEALLGTDQAFLPEFQAPCARIPGQARAAANLVTLLGGLGRSSRRTATVTTGSRTPTRCAAPPRCAARSATPSSTPRRRRPRARAPRSTTPWC